MYTQGVMEDLDEEKLAVLFVAILHEPRRKEERPRTREHRSRLARSARHAVKPFQRMEKYYEIPDPIRDLSFDLTEVVRHWARGACFESLSKFTEARDGDSVRSFRLGIQLMRQLRKAVSGDRILADRLTAAIRLVNRDVVDAERQLNLGQPPASPDREEEGTPIE
jgi:superfamily II RNA helicase